MLFGVLSNRDLNEEMLGVYKSTCRLPAHIFNQGHFLIDVRFLKQKIKGKFFYMDDVIALTVETKDFPSNVHNQTFPGPFRLKSEWELTVNNTVDP
jgi:hypothetical protein